MAKVVNDISEYCKYYKGESECPYTMDQAMAWSAEQFYVKNSVKMEDFIINCLDEYNRQGLSSFCLNDGIPVVLKAILFNRYEHYNEVGADAFKKWYEKMY